MSKSRQRPPDSFEEPLRAAFALMRKRKIEEACRLLARAKERALSKQETDDAALFSSVRGAYLAAMGRDSEALDAYREAERLSDSWGYAHSRLTTARHLVSRMKQPDKGLEIVAEILEAPSNSPAEYREARVIRGLARLVLDQPGKAVEELQAISVELSQDQPRSLSCDLTLVEELARRQLAPERCRHYLELVELKAREENEGRVLEKVLELKALLPMPDSSKDADR